MRKYVCIFCGANTGNNPEILTQTDELCKLLIQADYDLVYGGGNTGLMGRIADNFLAQQRKVIGVRPKLLIREETAHFGLTEMLVVENMLDRKAKMMELSDVFIALPGGVGTLDEILEVFTHVKLHYIDKPCLVLNSNNFYKNFINTLVDMVQHGYLKQADCDLLQFANTPNDMIAMLEK